MKNKLIIALLIMAVLALSACKSETMPITVENEPTEERIAKLRKEFGLESSEPSFFDNPLFHGDFGHSIDFGNTIDLRFLVTVVLLFFVGIFGVIYFKKKRKHK